MQDIQDAHTAAGIKGRCPRLPRQPEAARINRSSARQTAAGKNGSTNRPESAMNDDVVVFSENHSGLILKRRRSGFDEVEESVSSRLDMGTVLNVIGRPEPLCRREVSFIE